MNNATMIRTAAVLLTLALLGACRSTPFQDLPDSPAVCLVPHSSEQMPTEVLFSEVAMLERYYGLEPVGNEEGDLRESEELSGEQLRAILEARGFTVFSFSGSLREEATGLYDNLDAGRPVLVLLDPEPAAAFWALLVGYGKDDRYVVVQRPDLRARALPQDKFLPWWQKSSRLTLLAIPSELIDD